MQKRNLNLAGVLSVAGLFAAIVAIGLVGNIRSGNYVGIAIVFTAIAICGLAIFAGQFRVRLMFRDRTPDRIIAHYHGTIRRIPHPEAAAAYLSALAATFFGEFDRARKELEAVDWPATTPLHRGHRTYALALLALLEETDYPKALRLADEGRALESRDPAGASVALDDAIRLVADPDSAGAEKLERLERIARRQHGLMPGICGWALAVHYRRTNMPDKAADCKELVRLAVPFCAPLKVSAKVEALD